jgi:hypothetical protein
MVFGDHMIGVVSGVGGERIDWECNYLGGRMEFI